MAEEKKLNIFQKIQKARVELQKRDIKKTGFNKFSNYKYFELGDFLPHINEICLNVGLYTEFEYTPEIATLYVIDSDNPEEKRHWSTPVKIPTLKGCSEIQAIGSSQTFARRYLYNMAFEIAENDVIDSGAVDEDAEEAKRKISKAHVFTINKLIAETKTDIKSFLAWANVEKVEDITNDMFNECLKSFKEKKAKIEEKKKKADKEARQKNEEIEREKAVEQKEKEEENFDF